MGKFKLMHLAVAAAIGLGLASAASADEMKGKVKAVSNPGRTIAVEVESKGVVVFKFDGTTQFRNARSAADIIADEVVLVDYSQVGPEHRAKTITKVVAPLPAGVTRISADDLQALMKKADGNLLLVDSRPAGKYNEGHLPNAVSIPLNELEKQGEKLLPADKGKTLVFYCGGISCVLSPKSAALAVKLGFTDVRMYPEGEPGWKKLEYPTESSLSFVKGGNIVLVDLRSAENANAGYIPRAVNLPAAILKSAEKQFPEFVGAPIVFYSDREQDVTDALELMRDWGYRNATAFPGGVKAWQAAGNVLVTGSAPTKISYARKLADGEVSIKDFQEIIKAGSHLVIDARSADEFASGHFPGAVNIPSEEMSARLAEVPAGKQAVIHCSTGTRAEMAYDVLKGTGAKARYLRASVDFRPDKNVLIRE